MHLLIRGRSVPVSSSLREHCVSRMERALRPYRAHVKLAELVLEDVNGPRRGGACRMLVDLADGRRAVAHGRDSDFYSAIGAAASRIEFLVGRELKRARTRARTSAAVAPRTPSRTRRSTAPGSRRSAHPAPDAAQPPKIAERAPEAMARTAG